MTVRVDRRQFLLRSALAAIGAVSPAQLIAGAAAPSPAEGVRLGEPTPFSFQRLMERARLSAASPFVAPVLKHGATLDRIDYDAYQQVTFRRDKSLKLDADGSMPVQLFHMGKLFRQPVMIHIVDGAVAREVVYASNLFDTPANHPARELPDGIGFAGFRVMAPDLETDWLAFLGASYFRSSGPYNQYGLSARGLAIDTGLPTPEEFPRFTDFWLEQSASGGGPLKIYCLLDSPSAAGAYRMSIEMLTNARDIHRVVIDIECQLYARKDTLRLGIAPFSSMFWYGEASRKQAADWRPEIHDSDGLALWTGSGERIWRPLNNPDTVTTNAFIDRDPKGFGLLQRDRDFVHYLDDGVFYERRPSVWVEPLEPWGEGAVHLLEIPTDDEIHDNIAVYWCPTAPMRQGDNRHYSYRLSWLDDIPFPDNLAQATATWTGLGGRPGHKRPEGVRKFVIDFQGKVFAGLGRNDGVELDITTSRGTITNAYTHPVVDQRERWRALFDVEAHGPEPVNLRAYLRRNGTALTETWLYQHLPAM